MVPAAAAVRSVTTLTAVALDEFATPQGDLVADIFATKNTLGITCNISYNLFQIKTKYKKHIFPSVPFQRKSTFLVNLKIYLYVLILILIRRNRFTICQYKAFNSSNS